MTYRWANEAKTAIIREGIPPFYMDSGPEFAAAKATALPYLAPRARMIASRRQIRLALGEAGCEAMDAAANDVAYPWAIREQMKSAHEWHRTAQEIDEFGWIMGLSADEIDALFVQAMAF